jgi:hypothetical protein
VLAVHNLTKEEVGETRFAYEKYEHRDIPESEFALAAFGFPDLESPPASTQFFPVQIWLIIFGVVALSSGLLLKRYTRNQA